MLNRKQTSTYLRQKETEVYCSEIMLKIRTNISARDWGICILSLLSVCSLRFIHSLEKYYWILVVTTRFPENLFVMQIWRFPVFSLEFYKIVSQTNYCLKVLGEINAMWANKGKPRVPREIGCVLLTKCNQYHPSLIPETTTRFPITDKRHLINCGWDRTDVDASICRR